MHQALAEAYQEADRHSDAITEFKLAVKAAPQEPGRHDRLGDELWKDGALDEGRPLALQTESSDISTVIGAKQVIDLPLSLGGQKGKRAPEAFVFLTPGTVAYGSGNGNAGPSFFSKTSGGQNFGTEVILDGASTFRSENGSTYDETSPSVEAVGEFKVLTSTLATEYGRTTGGIEVFTTH